MLETLRKVEKKVREEERRCREEEQDNKWAARGAGVSPHAPENKLRPPL